MSVFKVSVETIDKIWDHPNADKLELASVDGMSFQFCIKKESFKVGDKVVYFPVDSLMPQDLIDHFGIGSFLTGPGKNRIRTTRLRGLISQGYVASLDTIRSKYGDDFVEKLSSKESEVDLTSALGVTKYEAPELISKAGNLVPLPDGVEKYDIESCQRFNKVFDLLLDQKVLITEKLEGSNLATVISPDGVVTTCQRNFAIVPIDEKEHAWIKASNRFNLPTILKKWQDTLYPNQQIAIRGELCGPSIQGNIYNLPELTIFAFDIKVNGKYVDVDTMIKLCTDEHIPIVPILAHDVVLRDWLDGSTVTDKSSGPSLLKVDTLREGIVIKPMQEQWNDYIGRMILKMRDPIYLDKTKN